MKRCIKILIFLFLFVGKVKSQTFVNSDLNGPFGLSVLPTNWLSVPYTDVVCKATAQSQATPDLTYLTGPIPSMGIIGNPYSGLTFLSGLHVKYDFSGSTVIFHEGIMQTVTGFSVGRNYSINFFQSVVKQKDVTDSSGSWEVYVGSNLIDITLPTTSYEPDSSTTFKWEFRSLSFTATSATHTFKFLPIQTDTSNHPKLRMGIDSIYIVEIDTISSTELRENCIFEMPNVFSPNNDGINDNIFPIEFNCEFEFEFIIYNRWGQMVYQTNELPISWDGKSNEKECATGVYFWTVNVKNNNVLQNKKGSITLFK